MKINLNTINQSDVEKLNEAITITQNLLTKFALNDESWANISLAFDQNFDVSKAKVIRQYWENSNFTHLPEVEIRLSSEINNAISAFSKDTNKIYLSKEYIVQVNSNLHSIAEVLLEEIGHFVDNQINLSDTSGDEGAIFAALVQGTTLPTIELQALKAENDAATIIVDGQLIQIEQAKVSGNGGEGGTTKTVPLEAKFNLVKFNWQNYSIPDEFQILYEGKRIAGNVGLQSGGGSGERLVVKKGSDNLEVKVTAPLEGTAWNFNVETRPLEINVNGFLGDVVKVDVTQELIKLGINFGSSDLPLTAGAFGIKNNQTNNGKGFIANTETWQSDLKNGIFYFVPKVTRTPLKFGESRSDIGLGESTLTITNGSVEIPIKFNIQDGYQETVTFGSKKIDVYRQEQRLSYLGFPQQSGDSLKIDGQTNDLKWAISLFNSVVNSKRKITAPGKFSKIAESFMNAKDSSLPPRWTELNTNAIPGVSVIQGKTLEKWGSSWAFRLLESVVVSFEGYNFNLNGASKKSGGPTVHAGHQAGMDLDIDTPGRGDGNYVPGNMFFKENNFGTESWYVEAPNGRVIIKNDDKYETVDPTHENLDKAVKGLSIYNSLEIQKLFIDFNKDGIVQLSEWLITDNPEATFTNQNQEPKKGYDINTMRLLIQKFLSANVNGITVSLVRFNDPRTWDLDPERVKFTSNHNGHLHLDILGPQLTPIPLDFSLRSAETSENIIPSSFATNSSLLSSQTDILSAYAIASLSNDLSNAIELGRVEGSISLDGSINSISSNVYYRFILGNLLDNDSAEGDYFTTPRDFSLLLSGIVADVDVELVRDFNEDGIRQNNEVIAISNKTGNSSEIINLTSIDEGVYYVQLLQKNGDTNYNLTISVPSLPVPIDNAGNIPGDAQDLGVINGSLTRTDFIGEVDTVDYYRFNLDSISDFSLEVGGLLAGDLVATLGQDINNDGVIDFNETIAISDNEGSSPEVFVINGLAAGTY